MDISKANTPSTFTPAAASYPACGSPDTTTPNVDPELTALSDRFFVSLRRDAFRPVRTQESELLAMPWGPRIDVIFHPKSAPGLVNGRVRLFARTTGGGDVEVAAETIRSADAPVRLSASMGCDEYVVKASAGTDPGPGARIPESYVFARVYDARH